MSKKQYRGRQINLDRLACDVENWLIAKGFEVQSQSHETCYIIQAAKEGFGRSLIGARRALTIMISGGPDKFYVECGTGQWIANLATAGLWGILTRPAMFILSGIVVGWSKIVQIEVERYIRDRIELESPLVSGPGFKNTADEKTLAGKMNRNRETGIENQFEPLSEFEHHAEKKKLKEEHEKKIANIKMAHRSGVLTLEEHDTKMKIENLQYAALQEAVDLKCAGRKRFVARRASVEA